MTRWNRWWMGGCFLWWAVLAGSPAGAQSAAPQSASVGGVEVHADTLEYEASRQLLTARGHAVVMRGSDILRANVITFHTDTQDAVAKGNVVLERAAGLWRGEEIHYNFAKDEGRFGTFEYFTDPFYIRAKDARQTASNEVILSHAQVTTCEGDHPLVYLRARRARLINNDRVKAHGVVFYMAGLPFFYLPYVSKRLDGTGWEFVPGRSSRMGAYLLTAYTFPAQSNLLSTTHIDYREKRGWGVGQDFRWGVKGGSRQRGLMTAYYADDQKPFKDEAEEETWGELVDKDRYRLRLSDTRSFSERDYFITELNYLSDPRIIEEFFDEEYRQQSQPENRVSLIHRGDRYTAGLTLNRRLNDFFGNVNRLPEATLDIPRMELGESGFYYESFHSAAWLEQQFPEGSDDEDYDAFRIDTSHMLYYPTRHFGFLNIIPRAGYRGTYYSSTRETTYVTNQAPILESNLVVGVTNEVEEVVQEGSGLRNVYETGLEASFKAFKVLHDQPMGRDYRGLRHVVEPYAKHTYIPEPNLRPGDLPQFDAVDRVDQQHDIYFGARNKWQTKRTVSGVRPIGADTGPGAASQPSHTVYDLLDVGVFTTYRLDPLEDEEDFSDIWLDARIRVVDSLPVNLWATYDPYESEVTEARAELAWLDFESESRVSVQYLYRKDRTDQVSGELKLWPNARWSFTTYARYALDQSELEEQAYFVEHRTSCLGIGVGYKEVDDDQQIWFQLWLTAFPKTYIKMGR